MYGGIHHPRPTAQGACRLVTVRPIPLTTNPTQESWKKALGVFEARLADVPLEYGTKLRCWKEVVARVHSDFAEKLPDVQILTPATGQDWGTTVLKDFGTGV